MKKSAKVALDQLLVERGLVESLKKARALIMAGDVIVMDQRVDKAGMRFSPDVPIRLREQEHSFVSRGGLKLEHALKLWPMPVKGAVCMDVGASTGGFTEVLLEHGAQTVYAIDVGYGQLAHKLRIDERVINLERTHILKLDVEVFSESPSIAVIDVSFISLEKVLPRVAELLARPAFVVALIKPQFEARDEQVAPGGIVKSEEVRLEIVQRLVRCAQDLGFNVRGIEPSPILGAKGNTEILLGLELT